MMKAERAHGCRLNGMSDYRNLAVTKKARELTGRIYRATEAFPCTERYGLTAQLRRAAISVGSNIAEGAGRGTARDFARFLRTARGSTYEIEFQLTVAVDLGYLPGSAAAELLGITRQLIRMLHSLVVVVAARAPDS